MLQLSLAFASLWRRLRAWPRKMLPAVRYLDSGLLGDFFWRYETLSPPLTSKHRDGKKFSVR